MFGLRWLTCCFAQNTPLLAPPAPTKATTQPTATGKPLAALSALLGYGYKTETSDTAANEDEVLRSPRRPALVRSDDSDISELDASALESAQRAREQAEQARIEEQIRQGSVANLYANRMCKVAPLAWSAYRRGSVDSSGMGSPTLKTPVLITPQTSREFEYDEPVRHSPPSPHAETESESGSQLHGLGFKNPPPGFGARYSARYAAPALPPPPVDAGIAQMLFNVEAREFGTSPNPHSARYSDSEDSDGTERGRSRRLSPITASGDEVVYKSIGLAGLGAGSARLQTSLMSWRHSEEPTSPAPPRQSIRLLMRPSTLQHPARSETIQRHPGH
ncbi:hypothetical protein A1Q2_06621 [Trichosporon asahii var. asahii CBS 8904]|uniref:Uncharacterized protein n=2 Tax=Trichosporon asahii var. asahii TaxID=189963 RepID=K1VDZ3_TRIAC|nr:hypothetical protein A1Q1_02497 [Trichosporon asahii var. asahii CBS 2479]EJT48476.1 hypothetical protein A1Q1_02497 [Trichosporon asahii var. asahii CBS 2479]EKC99080.1 hypothetical protein A1Q2_06621 [Trichosporon asahii var. asahii CBS 8904]